MSPAQPPRSEDYQHHTEAMLERPGVSRSTMMGLPCLRTSGAFFASHDTRTGRLLVKLPASRVQELIADGAAQPFAPAGRTFREWAAVPAGRQDTWTSLLAEAFDFVSTLPAPPSKPRTHRQGRRAGT